MDYSSFSDGHINLRLKWIKPRGNRAFGATKKETTSNENFLITQKMQRSTGFLLVQKLTGFGKTKWLPTNTWQLRNSQPSLVCLVVFSEDCSVDRKRKATRKTRQPTLIFRVVWTP